MALFPGLAGLFGKISRAIFKPLMPKILKGLNVASEAIDKLRDLGANYNQKIMLSDINRELSRQRRQPRLQSADKFTRIADNDIGMIKKKSDFNYLITGKLKYYDPLTLGEKEKYVSMYSRERYTQNEYEQQLYEAYADTYSTTGEVFLSVDFEDIEHIKDNPW